MISKSNNIFTEIYFLKKSSQNFPKQESRSNAICAIYPRTLQNHRSTFDRRQQNFFNGLVISRITESENSATSKQTHWALKPLTAPKIICFCVRAKNNKKCNVKFKANGVRGYFTMAQLGTICVSVGKIT